MEEVTIEEQNVKKVRAEEENVEEKEVVEKKNVEAEPGKKLDSLPTLCEKIKSHRGMLSSQ